MKAPAVTVNVTVELSGPERFRVLTRYGHARRPVLIDSVTLALACGQGEDVPVVVTGSGNRLNGDGSVGMLRAVDVPLRTQDLPIRVIAVVDQAYDRAKPPAHMPVLAVGVIR